MKQAPVVNTFSIVAYDATEQAWGIAVASRVLAVGAIVPWAKAGSGAIATQSYANINFGPDGLAMLAEGRSAQDTLDALLEADDQPKLRQVGVVDAQGHAAAHTGEDCMEWAGHLVGDGFTVQGNILTGEDVITRMAEAYTQAVGSLADRLLAAMKAGDDAGGDSRGKQGAAIYIARQFDGFYGPTDRYMDLRVDDHPEPVARLIELRGMHSDLFGS